MLRPRECDIIRSGRVRALHADRTGFVAHVRSLSRRVRACARRVRAVLFPWHRAGTGVDTTGWHSLAGPGGDRVRPGPAWRAPRTRREERRFQDYRRGPAPFGLRGRHAPTRREPRPQHRWPGAPMPDHAWLGWWPMTAWHFGLLLQAMVPLSGIALASALAEESASDPRHARPRA